MTAAPTQRATASAPSDAESPGSNAASSAVSTTGGQLWRRWRGPVVFVALLAVLSFAVALSSGQAPSGSLDPEGADRQGSRALAQILAERGVDVTVARSMPEAEEALGPDSTLLLTYSHRLLPEQLDRLAELPGDRVLVQPTTHAREALAPGVQAAGRADAQSLDPECGLRAAQLAGAARMGGELYSAAAQAQGGTTVCYPADGAGSLIRTETGNGTATVLGTGDPLRNFYLDDGGNAALALNLLSQNSELVWFVPDPAQPQDGSASLLELLPTPVYLAGAQLCVAVLLLALWRARRLGPLVSERLPVEVRAAETTEGRAGLYRARRAGDRAAAALRSGFIERVRPLLGLGAEAAPAAVVEAVAARAGRPPNEVRALLYGAQEAAEAPGDGVDPSAGDAALVRLADELDRLERKVRQS